MKSILLPINPMYRLYKNGSLFNTQRGKIVKPFKHSNAKPKYFQYDVFNLETGKREKIFKHLLIDKHFN